MAESIYIKRKIRLSFYFWLFLLIELAVFFYLAFQVFAPEELLLSKNPIHIFVLYLSYLLAVAVVPGIFKLYDIQRKKQRNAIDDKERADQYFFVKLLQYALLELSAALLLIAFWINEFYQPLYFFGIIYVTIFFTMPSLKQYKKDFLLNGEDDEGKIVYMPDEIDTLNAENPEQKEKS